MKENRLKAKIKARNNAAAECNRLYPILLEIYRPFVGKKTVNQTGCLVAKLKEQLEGIILPNGVRLHVFRRSSDYGINYTIRSSEGFEGECGCCSNEQSIFLGLASLSGKVNTPNILSGWSVLNDTPSHQNL